MHCHNCGKELDYDSVLVASVLLVNAKEDGEYIDLEGVVEDRYICGYCGAQLSEYEIDLLEESR